MPTSAPKVQVEVLRYPDRDAWLAARNGWVGGSDAAAILGHDPYRSIVEVWAQKRGIETPERFDPERAFWGLQLEESIGRGFGKRLGRKTRRPRPISVFYNAAFAGRATPDFFQQAGAATIVDLFAEKGLRVPDGASTWGVLQIKTADVFLASHWDDEPPLKAQIQLQHEMAACGVVWGTLACLVGGNRLRFFDDVLRPGFVAQLDEAIRRFQQDVLNGRMPAIDGTESCKAALEAMYPQHLPGMVKELPPVYAEVDRRRLAIMREIAELQKEKRHLENELRAEMAECEVGVLPSGAMYTLKEEFRKEHTVQASSSRVLRRRGEKKTNQREVE